MSFIKTKHFSKNILIIIFLFFLVNCQLQEPKKLHGINYLENRENLLIINKSNKNDVVNILGSPHSISINDDNKWFYFERMITRGKLHKLGRNVLKKNNILEIEFDKYGILLSKKLYTKDDMKKVKISKKQTENTVSQKSFIDSFLSSIKQKMYGQRQRKNK
tara:strand:- start:421 stop:906 length:486 start_codon:yes stop_codon:yes gene_type:complete